MAGNDPYMESVNEFSESEDEGIEDYRKGGYHAVRLADSFKNGRYIVQKKLGWGQFSTVWLVWDAHKSTYVAMKIQKSAQHFTAAAMDEIQILKHVSEGDPDDRKCVVKLLDHFKHSGPNGQHVCMVFEYLGDSLLSLIKYARYKGLPLDIVRKLCRQILVGLDYLHRELNIIHTDLKPENILLYSRIDPSKDPKNFKEPPLLTLPPGKPGVILSGSGKSDSQEGPFSKWQRLRIKRKAQKCVDNSANSVMSRVKEWDQLTSGKESGGAVQSEKPLARQPTFAERIDTLRSIDLRCKIVDVGNACFVDKIITPVIQTRQYRAPEVILGAPFSTSVDMWSFACIVFELITGDVLFNTQGSDGFDQDEDHLAMMMQLLGKIPRKIALGGNNSRELFDKYGDLKRIRRIKFWSLDRILVEKYKFSDEEAEDITKFICPLLDFCPDKRPTAEECLQHPWIKCERSTRSPSPMNKSPLSESKKVPSISKPMAIPSSMNSNRCPSVTVKATTTASRPPSPLSQSCPPSPVDNDYLGFSSMGKISPAAPQNKSFVPSSPLSKYAPPLLAKYFLNKRNNVNTENSFHNQRRQNEESVKLSPGKVQAGINSFGLNEGHSGFSRPRMFVSDLQLRASKKEQTR